MSITTTVEVKYRITYSDLKNAMLVYDRSNPSKFRSCLGIVCILSGLFNILMFGLEDLAYWIFLLVMGIIFLIRGLVYIGSLLVYRRNREIYKTEMDVVVDTKGVHAKMGPVDTTRLWEGYKLVIEDEKAFIFIYAKMGFFAIPKRALKSEAISQLRSLIHDNAPKSQLLQTAIVS